MKQCVRFLRGRDRTSALVIVNLALYVFLFLIVPVVCPDLEHVAFDVLWLGIVVATIFGGAVVSTVTSDWVIPDLIFLVLPCLYSAGRVYQLGTANPFCILFILSLMLSVQFVVLKLTKLVLVMVFCFGAPSLAPDDDDG